MNKIYLWDDDSIRTKSDRPSITPMLIGTDRKKPALLVIPGGGYSNVCETTEGSPIGKKFNALGYHAFILDYRTSPSRFPEPQLDAMRAMKLIRAHAAAWMVDTEQVYVCGFSAGAHLAGSLGTLCCDLAADNNDLYDTFSARPDGMILCYGVLAFEEWSSLTTQKNLLGEDFREKRKNFSLPDLITPDTPPAFLFHTIKDQVVDFRNSILFAEAMAAAGCPCQLALSNWGDHGMLLAKNTFDAVNWPEQADAFFKSVQLSRNDPGFQERYTHKYQRSQL